MASEGIVQNGGLNSGQILPSPEPLDPDAVSDQHQLPPKPRKSATDRPKPGKQFSKSSFGRPKRTVTDKWLHSNKAAKVPSHQWPDWDSSSCSSASSDKFEAEIPEINGGRSKSRKRVRTSPSGSRERRDPLSDKYSRFRGGNDFFRTMGKVSKHDGRLHIFVNEAANSGYMAKALGSTVKEQFQSGKQDIGELVDELSPFSHLEKPQIATRRKSEDQIPLTDNAAKVPRLNVVIMLIGSRGDVQPFIKIAKILRDHHGHRVRLATHPAFREFVEDEAGLEFFPIGGDPSELMAFMVKNPGLIPSVESVRAGDIGKRRASMYEMFHGMWRACVDPTEEEASEDMKKKIRQKGPFVADAIIANPPCFAHIHIAERLGIPLHIMFTFPYTPTMQFAHPLANIKDSNVDVNYTNFMSYPLIELMTWQGLGDLINRFRIKTLGLERVSKLWAPGQLYRLKVPHTYLFSPGLVPKPADWGPEIDVASFVYLDLASSFKAPKELVEFLDSEPPPIYIGFGSIVVDDPKKFTKLIFEAVKKAGVRALVSKGWGGLGDANNTPDNIYMLGNVPHDWLFPRVSAVVHHGGAGTTAIGLKCGRPTMVVPFFGDQAFWGSMIAKARAGAHECIPYKQITADKLAEGIKQCLTEEAKRNAQKIAESIEAEGDGAENAVRSFHNRLPLQSERDMRCSVLEDRVAVWRLKNSKIRLSALAAEVLVAKQKIKWNNLRPIRHYEWNDFDGPGEPVTGSLAAAISILSKVTKSVGSVPLRMTLRIQQREYYYRKRTAKKIRQKRRKRRIEKQLDGSAKVTGQAVKMNNGNGQLRRGGTIDSALSAKRPEDYVIKEIFHDISHGLKKTIEATIKAPMDAMVAMAQGFHNAPRLYGDDTVRRPIRITGLHSGLRRGKEEFIYGIGDAFTGLYRHPIHDAKESGIRGFFTGLGKGVAGMVFKPTAAGLGPPAYALKGLHTQLRRTRRPVEMVRAARMTQGRLDRDELAEGERELLAEEVERGWEILTLEERRSKTSRRWNPLGLGKKKEMQKAKPEPGDGLPKKA